MQYHRVMRGNIAKIGEDVDQLFKLTDLTNIRSSISSIEDENTRIAKAEAFRNFFRVATTWSG